MVKDKYGVPVGCAPSNGIYIWKEGRNLWGVKSLKLCNASASAIALTLGCDYVLYGPIGEAPQVFPARAVADAVVATAVRDMGITTQTRDHPVYKLFPEFAEELEKYA
jgi:tetrahydromethanopterin S-methyltransferase subunit H